MAVQEVREYATLSLMPNISYKIIQHLMTDERAEMLWKLLKYQDADAWQQPNLTKEEKAALIYNGQPDQSEYSVFLDFMMDDADTEMKTFLRIYPSEVYPRSRVVSICNVTFEVFTHSKINHLSNYTTRVDDIIQTLIQVLNGTDIGGVGVLYFDNQGSAYDKIQTIGQKPYKGKLLKMSVNVG